MNKRNDSSNTLNQEVDINTLPDDPSLLKALLLKQQKYVKEKNSSLREKDKTIQQQALRLSYLEEQFRLAQHKQFGQSSEKYLGQGELFNEPEEEIAEAEQQNEPETESISYERKKLGRKPLPKELPREVIVHDLSDEEKTCDCCQGKLHKMGEARSEQLEFIPAQAKVIEHVRPKYSCRHCEGSNEAVEIKIAPAPLSPIPKSMATPSLLSQIITSKYQYALPLYRQEALFKQFGIELNRKTMANWMIKCAELLQPIYDALKNIQLQQPAIHADETPVKVINDDKAKSYMWVYCTGSDSPKENKEDIENIKNEEDVIPNIVLFDYHASRAGQCAVDYLKGYNGYLQVDGYQAYDQTEATLVACWAHARRKFTDAQKLQSKGKTGKADWAINHIKKLYVLEKKLKDCSINERYEQRQEKAKPLLLAYKKWLDKSINQVPPKSVLGKAIGYSLNQWDKLQAYLENGHLNIDNNRAERAIRPFVIGRKNWLFSNTAKGANASAMLYSLVETAKANNVEPFSYLQYLFEEIPKKKDLSEMSELLPWVVKTEIT